MQRLRGPSRDSGLAAPPTGAASIAGVSTAAAPLADISAAAVGASASEVPCGNPSSGPIMLTSLDFRGGSLLVILVSSCDEQLELELLSFSEGEPPPLSACSGSGVGRVGGLELYAKPWEVSAIIRISISGLLEAISGKRKI